MNRATSSTQDPDALEVELLESRVGYHGFFGIDVHRLRHRRFDGGMTDVMVREIFERGDAVAVLPYDPQRDEVLLIRQFLPGAYFGGRSPRPLQIIAGMVGEGESEEEVARREAIECSLAGGARAVAGPRAAAHTGEQAHNTGHSHG